MKLISVIIPCYNVEKYISECLESIIHQTYSNWEIICVDDGSKDTTLSILKSYQEKHQTKITVVSVPNAGASAARNTGLKSAKGDYIQFIDADDLIASTKFEMQLAGFDDKTDAIVSDRILKNVDLTETLAEFKFPELEINPLETAVVRIIITGNPIYRKQVVEALDGYNETLKSAQDWDFHIRLVLAGYKLKYVPGIFYINRKVEGSISNNWKKVSVDAAELIIGLKNELIQTSLLNEATRQHLAEIYTNSAIYCNDASQSEKFIGELKFWANGNYSFINNKFKKIILNIIGISKLIQLYRLKNK